MVPVPFSGQTLREILLLFALVLACQAQAAAQEKALTADLLPVTPIARSGGPIPVVWRMTWNGAGLLEGHLQLTIVDEGRTVARVRIDDVVLSAGEQAFRAMLPAIATASPFGQLTVRAVFESPSRRIDLGSYLLRVPSQWQRVLTIGVCARDGAPDPGVQGLVGSLRFEELHPGLAAREEAAVRQLVTAISSLRPAEMPADPLHYCAFHVVVLEPAAFAELRDAPLGALRAWVAAGGSLCVFADGVLEPGHAAFLNALAGRARSPTPYLLDGEGRLAAGGGAEEDETDPLWLVPFGLGRAAIFRGPAGEMAALGPARWREAAAFLWYARGEQLRPIIETGQWDASLVRRHNEESVNYRARVRTFGDPDDPAAVELAPLPIRSGYELLNRLLPSDIDVLPLWLVGLILAGYVVLIGPVDYYLLGFFRQRKLTWILFPAVTAAVAIATVRLSHAYMAGKDEQGAVVFLDVGDGGAIVRENRYDVLFTGANRRVRTEVRGGLLTALDHQRFSGSRRFYGGPYDYGFEERLVGPPEYEGRMPVQFAVAQNIPQWTPQLNRRFSIAPAAEAPDFDWDGVRPDELGTLLPRVQQAFGPGAAVYLFRGNEMQSMAGGRLFSGDRRSPFDDFGASRAAAPPMIVGPSAEWDAYRPERGFLHDACVRSPTGLFSIVARVAPAGGDNFEDLALLDPTDPSQWLLVIAVERGGDLLIYRKLYTGDN